MANNRNKRIKFKSRTIGFMLIVVSYLMFYGLNALILVSPWSFKQKGMAIAVIGALSYPIFFGGTYLLGRPAYEKYAKRLQYFKRFFIRIVNRERSS